jgi:hypothetical protein
MHIIVVAFGGTSQGGVMRYSFGLVWAVMLVLPLLHGCAGEGANGDLSGCADDTQCDQPTQICNTDTQECECVSGLVLCDNACIPEIQPTLTSVQARVFEPSCVLSTCHGGDQPRLDLDLSSVAAAEASLVSVDSMEVPMKLRVAPGDNSASYLMNKLLGVDMATDTEQMPLEGTPLCEARLNAVRAWIDAGAPTE